MKTKELIEFVKEQSKNDWRNSNLHPETEEMLSTIADHFLYCQECREDFNAMEYKDFIELEEKMSQSNIQDWICESNFVEITTPNSRITMRFTGPVYVNSTRY